MLKNIFISKVHVSLTLVKLSTYTPWSSSVSLSSSATQLGKTLDQTHSYFLTPISQHQLKTGLNLSKILRILVPDVVVF